MNSIIIDHNPDEELLEKSGIFSWPIWTCEKSVFPWEYETQETCYFLDGLVDVTNSKNGETVQVGKGDLVTFPKGLKCIWNVIQPVRKHYSFD